MILDRASAMALLREYTQSESLLKHALCVEAAMRYYANYFQQSQEESDKWGITGLLHDFDYEKYPDPVAPDGHPFKGNEILTSLGYPQDLCDAIMGHAEYSGVPRLSLMAKTLFAVDELSGLIVAAALVRPDRSLANLEVSSIKKKFKDKAFARGCNRDDIRNGAAELNIELDQHMQHTLDALRGISSELGL